jgi:hypothetical protein
MMELKNLYPKYFQKSYTFLYSSLGFKKSQLFRPAQTYLELKNKYTIADKKLICLYENHETQEWQTFKRKLLENEYFETYYRSAEGKFIFIFSLSKISQDYDAFIEGKYSQFSEESKRNIQNYYGIRTPEWPYVCSFLYPEKFFKTYSQILDVEEELIKNVGELCDKYDPRKETLEAILVAKLVKRAKVI